MTRHRRVLGLASELWFVAVAVTGAVAAGGFGRLPFAWGAEQVPPASSPVRASERRGDVGAERVTRAVRLLVLDARREFAARLRGQLSDLDVVIDVVAATNAPRGANEAAAHAARHGADVVAWFEPGEMGAIGRGGSVVQVWIAGRGGVSSRRVGPELTSALPRGEAAVLPSGSAARALASDRDEASATLETAALVVRGAVRAVLLERSVDASSALGDPAPEREPAPSSPAPDEEPSIHLTDAGTASQQVSPRASAAPVWSPRAGVDWTYAGLSRNGAWSATAGFGASFGALTTGLVGSWGFPERIAYQGVELAIERRTLAASIGWEAPLLERWSLRPSLRLGAAWMLRSSRAERTGRSATPDEHALSPLVALDLALDYRPTPVLAVSLEAGVDWLTHLPRYVIATPSVSGAPASVAPAPLAPTLEAWRWQPSAGIALSAAF